MVFSSILFLFLFLPLSLGIYYVTPRRWRNFALLLLNLVFYGWGEPVYICIMIFSILVDYANGWIIENNRHRPKVAKGALLCSLVANLGMLLFFKYYDFIVTNLTALFPGLDFLHPLGISLPIGISFYTFQTMSYTIDVYWGNVHAQKNLVSFQHVRHPLPPVDRRSHRQIQGCGRPADQPPGKCRPIRGGHPDFCLRPGQKSAAGQQHRRFVGGLQGHGSPESFRAGRLAGRGGLCLPDLFRFLRLFRYGHRPGRMFGFEFKINFNYPYISRSITEFWRRWHISLSSWFREYVYIPLGGNRRGKLKTYRNILIVWLLTGIWHGAAWNFLCWGLFFALFLMLEKAFLLKWLERAPALLSHAYTIFLVLISWALFAQDDMGMAARYIRSMFGGGQGLYAGADLYRLVSYLPLLLILVVASLPLGRRLYQRLKPNPRFALAMVLCAAGLVVCTAYLVDASYNPFLYFRF